MNRPAAVVNQLTFSLAANTPCDFGYFQLAHPTIRGWSGITHLAFFHAVLAALPDLKSVLVCGVYQGLDLHLLAAAAKQYERNVRLVGVDLFSNGPLPDWKPEDRGKTWEEAQSFPPPSMDLAREACPSAELIKGNSIDYLRAHAAEFDFIYLDTSHDFATVHAEITAVQETITRPTLIAGDDYANLPGHEWGVDRACNELLPAHLALFNRIWIAEASPRPPALHPNPYLFTD